MSFRILPLSGRPDLIPTIAGWHYRQWGHLYPESTQADYLAELALHGRAGIPQTLVALGKDGRALGSASLVAEDIDGDPRTPWLASVFVSPQVRGQGMGAALVGAIESAGARLGTERLWLFTPDRQSLYAALGWGEEEVCDYRTQRITVMSKRLAR